MSTRIPLALGLVLLSAPVYAYTEEEVAAKISESDFWHSTASTTLAAAQSFYTDVDNRAPPFFNDPNVPQAAKDSVSDHLSAAASLINISAQKLDDGDFYNGQAHTLFNSGPGWYTLAYFDADTSLPLYHDADDAAWDALDELRGYPKSHVFSSATPRKRGNFDPFRIASKRCGFHFDNLRLLAAGIIPRRRLRPGSLFTHQPLISRSASIVRWSL